MKKYILIFLFVPFLVFGHTKPRNPIAPPGSWATNLVRAYAFSRLDSIRIDSVKDWSSTNQWGTSTAAAAAWVNAGTESPGYDVAVTAGRVVSSGNLSGSGITNKFTVVQRVKLTSTGTVNFAFSSHNRLSSPSIITAFNGLGFSQAGNIHVRTSSGFTNVTTGTLPGINTILTVIGTYDGDSVRVWVDGTRTGAGVRTNNIDVSSSYLLKIGEGDNGVFDNYYSGIIMMFCLWSRVITQTEINQITTDPYVMFKAATGKRGQVILIGSTQSAKMFVSLFMIALAIGLNRKFQTKKLTQR